MEEEENGYESQTGLYINCLLTTRIALGHRFLSDHEVETLVHLGIKREAKQIFCVGAVEELSSMPKARSNAGSVG